MVVGIVERWPSLADQVLVAQRLFGPSGPGKVGDWFTEQVGFVGDGDFARTFSDHVYLPGISSLDYAHRHVHTTKGDLLGGIRFYSRNLARPFVEVVAHDFDDLDALAACVHAEWSPFAVRYLRLRTRPGRLTGRSDVLLDKTIHAAQCRDMAPDDGRVELHHFDTAERALVVVADRYTHLEATDPVLSYNLSPAAPEDLRQWHARRQVWAITRHGDTVGALAVAPGAIGWIRGQEVNEEVISVAHTGHRYATSAQCAWAHAGVAHPTDLLVGMIDRHNHPSRATATRAGRARVLDDVFITLDHPPADTMAPLSRPRRGTASSSPGAADEDDGVRVRPWRPDDKTAVASLLDTSADVLWKNQFHVLHGLDDDGVQWRRSRIAIDRTDAVIGAATVITNPLHAGRMPCAIEVAPSWRRRGVGSLLLEQMRNLRPDTSRPLSTKLRPDAPAMAFIDRIGGRVYQRCAGVVIDASHPSVRQWAGAQPKANCTDLAALDTDMLVTAFANLYTWSHRSWSPVTDIYELMEVSRQDITHVDRMASSGAWADGQLAALALAFPSDDGIDVVAETIHPRTSHFRGQELVASALATVLETLTSRGGGHVYIDGHLTDPHLQPVLDLIREPTPTPSTSSKSTEDGPRQVMRRPHSLDVRRLV
ncbi:hypothetical protein B1R94_00175 [Mycolicibacterium litorale]|nr:hypothetical protein B1R94_00175 [Mycolicibacterium litorale]